MKLFADPRVKCISLSEYLRDTDPLVPKDDFDDDVYYMTPSFAVIAKYKTVFTNFGEDIKERFDCFIVAPRDGKTEYEAIERNIVRLNEFIAKYPKDTKLKSILRKYWKAAKTIPDYVPYEPAKSGNCFDESLINVDYIADGNLAKDYVVLDVETNGLSKKYDDLLSISIYDPFKRVCYNRFLPLDMQPSVATTDINGITDEALAGKLHINQEEADRILEFFNLEKRTLLVYGPDDFDSLFVQNYLSRHGITGFENLKFENIKRHIPSGAFEFAGSASKDNMCRLFDIEGVEEVHSGLNDCLLEWKLFEKFRKLKPIRIGDKFFKYSPDYVVPVTVLIQNPKIYEYSDIPVRYVLGEAKQVFRYSVSSKALDKIKKFGKNITGISLENVIYAGLGAVKQDNSSFLIKNKMKLEKIATIETDVDEIPIRVAENGLIEAVDEKDKAFIDEVNDVSLVLKEELKSTFEFIKSDVFANEAILSQELVLSENDKVLALCDLSSKSAVMEIKTIALLTSNIGYLLPSVAYQLFYQAKHRSAYYLHISMGGGHEIPGFIKIPEYCDIVISRVELNEYSREEYEKKLSKLTPQEEAILNFIKKNPDCQYKDLEEAFQNLSRKMIEERMKSLERKKHIVRIGSKRKYHWEVCESN